MWRGGHGGECDAPALRKAWAGVDQEADDAAGPCGVSRNCSLTVTFQQRSGRLEFRLILPRQISDLASDTSMLKSLRCKCLDDAEHANFPRDRALARTTLLVPVRDRCSLDGGERAAFGLSF
jgi:hypothetical protein